MTSIRRQLSRWVVSAVILLFALAAVFCYLQTISVVDKEFDLAQESRAQALGALVLREPSGKLEVNNPDLSVPSLGAARHPDYLQIWDSAGKTLVRSRSLGQQDVQLPGIDANGAWDVTLPDGRPGRGVRVQVVPGPDMDAAASTKTRPAVISADDRITLALLQDRTPRLRVQRALLTALLLTLGLLCAGVLLIMPRLVRRGLLPLERVSVQAAQIEATSLSRRFDEQNLPLELQPICQRLNELLARLESAFERERRFTANVAHELRTPIAELRALAEVALRWPGDPTTAHQSNLDALEISQRMQGTVTALLELARCEAASVDASQDEIDLCSIVRRAYEPLAECARRKNLEVRWDLPATHFVRSKGNHCRSIVANLLENAVHYSSDRGTLVGSINEKSEFSLSNTNTTFVDSDLPHLTEPFWRKESSRTDSTHAGLGLPLVVAYAALVTAQVRFELPSATTFVVTVQFPPRLSGRSDQPNTP